MKIFYKFLSVLFFFFGVGFFGYSHTFNPLSRGPYSELELCQKTDTESLASKYTKDLINYIAINSPDVFHGEYSIDLFCAYIIKSKSFGGSAEPTNRSVKIRMETFMASQFDAQVAAVLSHELAHVLLQHNHPLRLQPLLEASPEFITINNRRIQMNEIREYHKQEIRWDIDKIRNIKSKYSHNEPISPIDKTEIEKITLKINSHKAEIETMDPEFKDIQNQYFRLLKILTPPELSQGWQEDEADELGYYLYLKAGFYSSGFYEALFRSMNQEERNECEVKYLSQINVPGYTPPPRVKGSLIIHSEPCYRIYNLMYLERKKHFDLYEELLNNAVIQDVFPGELKKIHDQSI